MRGVQLLEFVWEQTQDARSVLQSESFSFCERGREAVEDGGVDVQKRSMAEELLLLLLLQGFVMELHCVEDGGIPVQFALEAFRHGDGGHLYNVGRRRRRLELLRARSLCSYGSQLLQE